MVSILVFISSLIIENEILSCSMPLYFSEMNYLLILCIHFPMGHICIFIDLYKMLNILYLYLYLSYISDIFC